MPASSILTQGQGQTRRLAMKGAVEEAFPVHQRTPDDNVLILYLYILRLCQNEKHLCQTVQTVVYTVQSCPDIKEIVFHNLSINGLVIRLFREINQTWSLFCTGNWVEINWKEFFPSIYQIKHQKSCIPRENFGS